jgi:hypothetical protein
MIAKIYCAILVAVVVILAIVLVKVNKSSEGFTASYDPKCLDTCHTQSANADDQCMNECQMPCNNTCWENCFKKADHFDDYLRCGVRCPYGYFSS